MHELEKILGYQFNNILNLADAMYTEKINIKETGRKSKNYYNDSLSVMGDSALSTILSEQLFKRGYCKGDITEIKARLEDNDTLKRMSDEIELMSYAFNEYGFLPELEVTIHPPYSNHNQYLEAIIGAVFFDSNFEECKSWIQSVFHRGNNKHFDQRIQ